MADVDIEITTEIGIGMGIGSGSGSERVDAPCSQLVNRLEIDENASMTGIEARLASMSSDTTIMEPSTSNISDTSSDDDVGDTSTDSSTHSSTHTGTHTSTTPTINNNKNSGSNNKSNSNKNALKIMFLSSDTGGGHRASSESLANQFQLLYPGSTFELHDVVDGEKSPINYFGLVKSYRHLSAHPTQWKILYEVTNSRAFELLADANMKLMCERSTRKRIMSIDPDVVVSVHPMMTNVPQLSCVKIAQQTGKHIPIFTVVTDLGSGHCLWFAPNMERMFVGSDQIWSLAQQRGNVPSEKLVNMGLPIRHGFAVQAEQLGDRMSDQGKAYQASIRSELKLPHTNRATLLVMGGGEGVGSLSDIVNHLYVELVMNGIDAIILVVCGRNQTLQDSIANRNWDETLRIHSHLKIASRFSAKNLICGPSSLSPTAGCIEGGVTKSLRKILSSSSLGATLTAYPALTPTAVASAANDDNKSVVVNRLHNDEARARKLTSEERRKQVDSELTNAPSEQSPPPPRGEVMMPLNDEKKPSTTFSFDSCEAETPTPGKVAVLGLGFVERMAEYMVAADILLSKAGPGTIMEAAALSLPVMLTSFLPGQEEGNVDFCIEGGFGAYVNDRDPVGIAEQVVAWLQDDGKMAELSQNAKAKGAPYAARDIAKAIGDSTLKWKEINEENGKACIADTLAEKKKSKGKK